MFNQLLEQHFKQLNRNHRPIPEDNPQLLPSC